MAHLALFDHIVEALQSAAFLAAPDLPLDVWWLPIIVLGILGISATVDALTGTIPDWVVFFGMTAVTMTMGISKDWPFAAEHLRAAIGAGIGLWLLNTLWRRAFKGDAYGMGDAKWTMLAVIVFGFEPALFAWGAGACLAVLWMGGAQVVRRPIGHVYLGPFLFIGLLMGIYWLKLR